MNAKNRKLTENKFKPGDARPELVEDWDQVENPFVSGVRLPQLPKFPISMEYRLPTRIFFFFNDFLRGAW